MWKALQTRASIVINPFGVVDWLSLFSHSQNDGIDFCEEKRPLVFIFENQFQGFKWKKETSGIHDFIDCRSKSAKSSAMWGRKSVLLCVTSVTTCSYWSAEMNEAEYLHSRSWEDTAGDCCVMNWKQMEITGSSQFIWRYTSTPTLRSIIFPFTWCFSCRQSRNTQLSCWALLASVYSGHVDDAICSQPVVITNRGDETEEEPFLPLQTLSLLVEWILTTDESTVRTARTQDIWKSLHAPVIPRNPLCTGSENQQFPIQKERKKISSPKLFDLLGRFIFQLWIVFIRRQKNLQTLKGGGGLSRDQKRCNTHLRNDVYDD